MQTIDFEKFIELIPDYCETFELSSSKLIKEEDSEKYYIMLFGHKFYSDDLLFDTYVPGTDLDFKAYIDPNIDIVNLFKYFNITKENYKVFTYNNDADLEEHLLDMFFYLQDKIINESHSNEFNPLVNALEVYANDYF